MSRIDSALEDAGRQWRDEVDAAYGVAAQRQAQPPRRGRNRVWAGLATATAVVVAAVVWLTSSGGDGDQHRPRPQLDCAGPVLQVAGGCQPLPVRPGQALTVQGKYYGTGCQDAAGNAAPQPIASVRLTLTDAGGRRVVLATAHPAGEL